MRFLIACFLLILFVSCQDNVQKPSFLIGNWVRTNNSPGEMTYENWKSDFTGIGFTLKEKDTTFKEILSIVNENDSLYLKVEGVNKDATLFKITSISEIAMTAENPKHDFPTEIKYWLENDTLKAKVSNTEFGIDFSFVRLNKIN